MRRAYLSVGQAGGDTYPGLTVFSIRDEGGRPVALLCHGALNDTPPACVEERIGGTALFLRGTCEEPEAPAQLSEEILRAAAAAGAVENPGIAVYERTVILPGWEKPLPISVLRIGRTGLFGVPARLDAENAARLHEDTMFLGTLTVQAVNGDMGHISRDGANGPADRLEAEAASFLRWVQDDMHRMDPAVVARYPHRRMDVPYGDEDPSQKLDIWYPNDRDGRPLPVVLMLHGGAFQHGDKFEDATEPMLRGLERGYAVVSANYRLAPQFTYPTPILDGKKALHYLRANAGDLGLDPARIALWGFSSGAWLVSMVALTAGDPVFGVGSPYPESVQAVIDWCGPCGDFTNMDPAITATGIGRADHSEAGSPESLFMGAKITDIPEQCAEACPIAHIRPDAPPFLIIHGDADPVVPLDQSQRFYSALRDAGCGAEMYVAPGKGHHGEPWYHEPWVSDMCFDFLDRRLKGPGESDT